MKHKTLLLLFAVALLLPTTITAQSERLYPKYINFSYGTQKLKSSDPDLGNLSSELSAAFTAGRTYYLPIKPVLGMVRFGIDWSFIDLNFAYYKEKDYDWDDYDDYCDDYDYYCEEDYNESVNTYQVEAGMHVGPSITVTPIKGLSARAYFRYAPSASMILMREDTFSAAYGSFFVSGVNVSYKLISLGVEGRWGKGKYNCEIWGEDSYGDYEYSEKITRKTSGARFYLSFRF